MTTEKTRPIFGVSVLESLTLGMYVRKLDALRELVQNSCDAIKDARELGILKLTEGTICVALDSQKRKLTVRDDGTGISRDAVLSRLTNVGVSEKDALTDIGFRGIGRLAGIAYCDRLRFRTSAKGESVESEVTLDAKGLREIMSTVDRKRDRADEVLYACTDLSEKACKEDEHFFEVTLEGITPEAADDLLAFQSVQSYLAQTAPVGFDTNFIFGPVITKWLSENDIKFFTVQLKLSDSTHERLVYKPYKTTYKRRKDAKRNADERLEVQRVKCVRFPDDGDCSYWAWYSETDFTAQIGEDSVAGLRLRIRNMSVGDSARLDELLNELRFNRYYIGEIHVVHQGCVPNARRDGIEDSPAWATTRELLRIFMKEREKQVRQVSESNNDPIAKIIRDAIDHGKSTIAKAEGGFATKTEREKFEEETTALRGKLEKTSPEKVKDELKEAFAEALGTIKNAETAIADSQYVVQKTTKGKLNRQQRTMLQAVLEILEECLPKQHFETAKNTLLERLGVAPDA